MHWRHKAALQRWACMKELGITFHGSPGIGEAVFMTAIKNGWLEATHRLVTFPRGPDAWWKNAYRFTDAGRTALKEANNARA
jgi:hypothetical protein